MLTLLCRSRHHRNGTKIVKMPQTSNYFQQIVKEYGKRISWCKSKYLKTPIAAPHPWNGYHMRVNREGPIASSLHILPSRAYLALFSTMLMIVVMSVTLIRPSPVRSAHMGQTPSPLARTAEISMVMSVTLMKPSWFTSPTA